MFSVSQTTITSVNSQLESVDAITKDVGNMTTNAAALTSIVSSTLGSPLIKVAAFSYGVRKSVGKRRDAELLKANSRRHRASHHRDA